MSVIAREYRSGTRTDELLESIKSALDEYERAHPGSEAALYRQNPGSIRVRLIDDRFALMSRAERHEEVFAFLAGRLLDDTLQEISVLLVLPRSELSSSFMNAEFEDPTPSYL